MVGSGGEDRIDMMLTSEFWVQQAYRPRAIVCKFVMGGKKKYGGLEHLGATVRSGAAAASLPPVEDEESAEISARACGTWEIERKGWVRNFDGKSKSKTL